MDWQRSLLITLLAIVSYMMILQWNKDYGTPLATPSTETSPQNYPQTVTPSADTDVPVASSAPPAATNASPSAALISVQTDTLDVLIDPQGGDIVNVRLRQYPVSIDRKHQPFTLLANSSSHVYVAQSGLAGTAGPDKPTGRALYSTSRGAYTLSGKDLVVPLEVTLETGVHVRKEFVFERGSHLIKTRMIVDNRASTDWTGTFYAQIKRDDTPDPGVQGASGFGLPTFLGVAYWSPEQPYNKYTFDDMRDQALDLKAIQGGWIAMLQHYFLSAWVPDPSQKFDYSTAQAGDHFIARLVGTPKTVAAGTQHTFEASLYVGPKIQKTLEAIAPDKGLNLVVDYGPLFFISKFLFWLLSVFQSLTGNWGIAIILLTLAVKAMFFYPSAMSYRSMAKMRVVQPQMLRLREQYADDRQKLSQEMMKLYRDNNINPLGGCLPILIQMPVFLALYWALLESVELRQAPFFGWIEDLSIMDPYFILPLIMGGTMYIQQMLNPAPPDPMQAKVMKFMPIMFTVLFLWFPAGLVIYWITNNTLSILQQWYITRKIESEGTARR